MWYGDCSGIVMWIVGVMQRLLKMLGEFYSVSEVTYWFVVCLAVLDTPAWVHIVISLVAVEDSIVIRVSVCLSSHQSDSPLGSTGWLFVQRCLTRLGRCS